MTTMNLQMSLTLADAASGPLRAFTSQMEALRTATNTVGARLESIAAGITAVARASSAASGVSTLAGSLSGLSGAMAAVRGEASGAATAIGAVGQRASAAGVGTYALEQAMGALGGTLTSVAARLTEIAVSFAAIGAEARVAGAGVKSGMAGMEAGMVSANAQAGTLMTTLKGLGQIYAAMKIEKGLKASAEDAIEFQNTQTRLRNMNVGAAGESALMSAADAASKAVPQFSRNQTLEMGIDLRNATGSVEHALEMLQPFAIAAYSMRMATPAGQTFNDRDMLLIAKALEQRNATMDPARMQAELDMITKIYAATQGRVDAQQILGNLQYSKGGLGQSMDLSFLPIFAAMIEQIKAGGGNGGQIGTALTSLQQSIISGTGNGQAQKERARLGLLDPDKLVWNRQGNIDQQKSDLRMAGAEEFQRNPYEWVQNYLKPAMIRAGIDLTNDAAVNQTLNRLFPNRNAANIASTMVNRGPLLEKDAANIVQSADSRQQYENDVKTAQANIDAFKAQLANLGIVLGTTLLPAITTVAKAFTEMFQGLAAFFQQFPASATFLTYAAGIGAVVLAIAGFKAVFGIAGSLVVELLGLGAASTATAGAVGSMAGIVSGAFARMLPLVGTLILAWDFGGLIAHLNVGGKQIQEWGANLIEWVVDAFRSGWGFIGRIVSSVIPGAQAAQAAGKAGPPPIGGPLSTGGASGSWGVGPAGATGSWEAPPGKIPASVAAAARLFAGTTGPGAVTAGGRGRVSTFNPGADIAANDFKREESELRNNIKVADALYKEGALSIENYYISKQAALENAVEAEIAALNKERDAFAKAKNERGVNRVDTQLEAVRSKLESGTEQNQAERKQKLIDLDKEAAKFKRDLLMTEGQRHAAEALNLQQEMEEETKRLVLNGKITQEEADAAMVKAKARIELKLQEQELGKIREQFADKFRVLDEAEKAGTISGTAADKARYDLRVQEVALIDQEIAKQRALAEAAGDQRALLALDRAQRQNTPGLSPDQVDQATVLKTAQGGFQTFFATVMNGSKSASQAFKAFGQTMFDTINNLVAKKLGDALFDSIFGGMSGGGLGPFAVGGGIGGGRGGGGGLLGGILGPLFGSGGGGSLVNSFMGSGFMSGLMAPTTVAGTSFADALSSGIIALADGTDYVPHDMLALIHEGERVMPAKQNAAFTAMGGQTLHQTVNINMTGSMDARTRGQLVSQMGAETSRAMKRYR